MAKPICVLAMVVASCLAPSIAAATNSSAGGHTSSRDLSQDSSRVGSLAGGVWGGALTVHPGGIVAGAVIGYVVGKRLGDTPEESESITQVQPKRVVRRQTESAQNNPLSACLGSHSNPAMEVGAVEGDNAARNNSRVVTASNMPTRRSANRRLNPCFYYSSY